MPDPPDPRTLRARDVMSRDPLTIDPDAPVQTAVAVMREREVRHLPAVDERGALIGLVSDRDLRSALLTPGLDGFLSGPDRRRLGEASASLENLRVRDVMTWGAVTIRPDAPLAQVAALMVEGRLGCLPVVAEGRLVGIVTERDVLRALAATLPAVRGGDPDTYLP